MLLGVHQTDLWRGCLQRLQGVLPEGTVVLSSEGMKLVRAEMLKMLQAGPYNATEAQKKAAAGLSVAFMDAASYAITQVRTMGLMEEI